MALDTNILANGMMGGGNPFRNALAAQSIRQNDQAMRINQQDSENRNKLFERQAVLDQKQQTQADEAAGREKALMQAQFIAKAVPELKKYATTAERASAVQGMSQMAAQMGIPLDQLTPDHLTDQQLDMTLSQIVPFIEQMSQIKQVSQPVTIINPETGVPEVVIPVTDDKGVTRNNLIGRSNAQTPQENADLADAQMRARLYEEQRLRQSDPAYQADLKKKEAEATRLSQDEAQKNKSAMELKATTLKYVDRLLSNRAGIEAASGILSSKLPTFSQNTKNAELDLKDLASMLTSENLKLMSGILTDSDIKFLGAISAGELSLERDSGTIISKLEEIKQRLSGGGTTNPAKVDLSPEDSAAMDWAKSNPNDPRAQQILKMLGGK